MALILTDTGYVAVTPSIVGVRVKYYDPDTGATGYNTVESVQWVDAAEWERWWQGPGLSSPPFAFRKINGTWTLNSEQSIWRDDGSGVNVCHAKHLNVGDTIYDDEDNPVTITSIEEVTADGWWRFDIDGDHSYIIDGLTVHNASRFWVGNGGTWDSSSTTHWASTTGGSSGASAPGSADTVTIDGSSGSGTITPDYSGFASSIGTFQSITCGAMGMTIDWSVNNNSITLSATGGFNGSGSGTRTIRLGNGTWTLSATNGGAGWSMGTITNLTFNANSSTIIFAATTGSAARSPNFGNLTYSTVTFQGGSGSRNDISGSNTTFGTFNVNAGNVINLGWFNNTFTFTNGLNITGTSSLPILFIGAENSSNTFSCTADCTFTWCGFHLLTCSGGGTFTATSSQNYGKNSGITITAPSTNVNVINAPVTQYLTEEIWH